MKRVISVSLGSTLRNMRTEVTLLGERVIIERIGTDGSMEKAISLVRELDGRVDALGMGGIDLYICAGQHRYAFRDAARIARAAQKTPIVDGSGLKNTLERKVIRDLESAGILSWKDTRVFLVCGADRFGMAQALAEAEADIVFGDLMIALGLPWPLTSLEKLERAARFLGPLVAQLPFSMVYPTGKKQGQSRPRFARFYEEAEVIAGDFHLIWKHLPSELPGKVILTNTLTAQDVQALEQRGISRIITTTPELEGRSFGTNVMEAVLVALLGRPPEDISPGDYEDILDRVGFKPRIQSLGPEGSRTTGEVDSCQVLPS